MRNKTYKYNVAIKINFIDFFLKLNQEEKKDIENSILQGLSIEYFVKEKLNIPKEQIIVISY